MSQSASILSMQIKSLRSRRLRPLLSRGPSALSDTLDSPTMAHSMDSPLCFLPQMASDKAIKTRQSILDAAKAIIIEEGIGALTMERAATKAGISKGACMYHFKSKRALQAALVEEYAAHLSSELARHEALLTGLPRKRSFQASSNGSAALIMTTTAGQQSASPSIPISCTTKNSCVL